MDEATAIPSTELRQFRAGNNAFFPKVVEMGKQGVQTILGHNVKSNKRMDSSNTTYPSKNLFTINC